MTVTMTDITESIFVAIFLLTVLHIWFTVIDRGSECEDCNRIVREEEHEEGHVGRESGTSTQGQ